MDFPKSKFFRRKRLVGNREAKTIDCTLNVSLHTRPDNNQQKTTKEQLPKLCEGIRCQEHVRPPQPQGVFFLVRSIRCWKEGGRGGQTNKNHVPSSRMKEHFHDKTDFSWKKIILLQKRILSGSNKKRLRLLFTLLCTLLSRLLCVAFVCCFRALVLCASVCAGSKLF